MIQASAAFLAANAKLNKEPVFLIAIEGYSRAFCNKDLGGTYRLAPIPNDGGSVVVPATAGPWNVDVAVRPFPRRRVPRRRGRSHRRA